MRAVLRDPQLVEQLVEVPTIVSYASLLFLQVMQRIVEQNVDIPVVGGGAGGGLSGFLPGQNYSVTAEQIVDNPVPRPGGAEGLPGLPVDRVQQRFWSRSPSFLIKVEVFKIFSQFRVPQRLLRFLLDKLVKGFYALFPRGRNWVRSRAHGRRGLSWVWYRG